MTNKPADTRARVAHYLLISGTNYAKVQIKPSSFSAGLLTELGMVKALPENGNVIAVGKAQALGVGCFPINLVYEITAGGRTQTAKVLCAPAKADTALSSVKNNKYNDKNIIDARPPRRRIFTF